MGTFLFQVCTAGFFIGANTTLFFLNAVLRNYTGAGIHAFITILFVWYYGWLKDNQADLVELFSKKG